MYCPQCHAEYGSGPAACPKCGVPLEATTAEESGPEGATNTTSTGRLLGNAVGAIIAFNIALVLFPTGDRVGRVVLAAMAGAIGVLLAEGVRVVWRNATGKGPLP